MRSLKPVIASNGFAILLTVVFLLPITLIVLLTGFAISTGTSEKFIYFDF